VTTETCKQELAIEVPAEEAERELKTVTAQYARVARIPGFRPGHAPSSLVLRRFREDIRKDVVQTLLPKFFDHAVKERKWLVVGQPHFEDLKFEEALPLTCKAVFEVYPEFELNSYQGLDVEEDLVEVADADVDRTLEALRQRAATFEVVEDRPAQEGDFATVNYRSPAADIPEARDAVVELGGKGTVPAFTTNLLGTRGGDKREFEVAYPEDFPKKSLAGRKVSYQVEVQSIKRKVVPALDDGLAKTVSECATLEELRGKLREELGARRQREAEAATQQKLVDKLLAAHEFPVPEILVESQLDRRLERMVGQLLAQGIDPRTTELDWRKLREESRPAAEKEVRAGLILDKVADAEKIEVSEEEVDEMIRQMAQERQEPPAALKTRLTRDGEIDRIRTSRRSQKVLEVIYRSAKITRKSEAGPAQVEK
jgi:trigger factor